MVGQPVLLQHILSALHNLSLRTKCAPLTAHFVAPCTHCHPKTTKCASVHGTFCRQWESTGPGRTVRIYTMLPPVWCIASALRQAFPNWPWKLYCILIKEVVDSLELFIYYLREDIINAPTLDTFKARLDKCWSRRKFICTKLAGSTKQLKSQNKDYLEGNENTRSTERPWCLHIVVTAM